MSDEEIPGRNLVAYSNFDPGWDESWIHDGTGFVRELIDPDHGYYMLMNERAQLLQSLTSPVFTAAQWPGVKYRLAFLFENAGNGKEPRVVVKTSLGKETNIDLSGIAQKANWNDYEPLHLEEMTVADTGLDITLHGSEKMGAAGLRITQVRCDLLLDPLEVTQLKLDEKVYIP